MRIVDILRNLLKDDISNSLVVNESKSISYQISIEVLFVIAKFKEFICYFILYHFFIFIYFLFLIKSESVDQYLKTFQWDTMKFRAEKSMQEIAEILNQVE